MVYSLNLPRSPLAAWRAVSRSLSVLHASITRRDMLHRVGTGMGVLGLAGVMADSGLLAAEMRSANALAPKGPQFPARAKRVIHLFMNGGPSQVDTFDPKPELTKRNGQMPPGGVLKTE